MSGDGRVYTNGLTAAAEERLALFVEEAGECLQAAGKVLRHGWTPTDRSVSPPVSYDNRADLAREIGQLMHAARLLCEAGDLDRDEIQRHFEERGKNVRQYLHHQ